MGLIFQLIQRLWRNRVYIIKWELVHPSFLAEPDLYTDNASLISIRERASEASHMYNQLDGWDQDVGIG